MFRWAALRPRLSQTGDIWRLPRLRACFGGGALRDVLAHQVPMELRGEIYAMRRNWRLPVAAASD